MAEGVSSRRRAAAARPQGPAPMMRTSRMSGKDVDDCVVLPTMSGWIGMWYMYGVELVVVETSREVKCNIV